MYPDDCVPILSKGAISRNPQVSSNSVQCLSMTLGNELTSSTMPQQHLDDVIQNLVQVATGTKVSV